MRTSNTVQCTLCDEPSNAYSVHCTAYTVQRRTEYSVRYVWRVVCLGAVVKGLRWIYYRGYNMVHLRIYGKRYWGQLRTEYHVVLRGGVIRGSRGEENH